MKISKIVSIMISVSMIFCAVSSPADEVKQQNVPGEKPRSGLMLPSALKQCQEAAQAEVDKKNLASKLTQDVISVSYNDDNTLKTVKYADGTELNYSYVYDERGSLTAVTIGNNEFKITFQKVENNFQVLTDKNSIGNTTLELKVGPGTSSLEQGGQTGLYYDLGENSTVTPNKGEGQPGVSPKSLTVYCYKPDLQKIATTPAKFDFKAIENAVNKTSELNSAAYTKYEINTADYYTKMETKLKDQSADLKSSGVNVAPLAGNEKTGVKKAERNAIDRVVKEIYSKAKERNDEKTLLDLIDFEASLRKEILMPAREAYEADAKDALEPVNDVIDKLLDSNLALYMNVKKDKIDVVINLPKKP